MNAIHTTVTHADDILTDRIQETGDRFYRLYNLLSEDINAAEVRGEFPGKAIDELQRLEWVCRSYDRRVIRRRNVARRQGR